MSKMPRRKTQITAAEPERSVPMRSLFNLVPWIARHESNYSEIDVYAEGSGQWVTLADIYDSSHVDAEGAANYIVRAVNSYANDRSLIAELTGMLHRCLAAGRFDLNIQDSIELLIKKAETLR